MKIAVIGPSIFPRQQALWRVCSEQVELVILGTDTKQSVDWEWTPAAPEDVPFVSLRPIEWRPGRGHLWWTYSGLSSALSRLKPDIAHVLAEPWGLLAIQALQATRSKSTKVVVHGAENLYRQGGQVEALIRRRLAFRSLQKVDGFVGWHSSAVQAARTYGLRESAPTEVIPAVVPDPTTFSINRVPSIEPRSNGAPVRVGFLGRLVPEKGVMDLLAAMELLKGQSIRVQIWGAGPLEEVVVNAAARQPEQICYLGPLSPEKVPLALNMCDILAAPSLRTTEWVEQFGRIVLEAMICSLPVVAYASGALPDLVGKGGVLVREGDRAGLARAISTLSQETGLRASLGEIARRSALQRFHPNVLAKRMISYWETILGQS